MHQNRGKLSREGGERSNTRPCNAHTGWRQELREPMVATGRAARCRTHALSSLACALDAQCWMSRVTCAHRDSAVVVVCASLHTAPRAPRHRWVPGEYGCAESDVQRGTNNDTDTDTAPVPSQVFPSSFAEPSVRCGAGGCMFPPCPEPVTPCSPHLFTHSSPTPLVVASGQRIAAGCERVNSQQLMGENKMQRCDTFMIRDQRCGTAPLLL